MSHEQKIESEIKHVAELAHQLDLRVVKVETGFSFIQKQLDNIENNVNAIYEDLRAISNKFSVHTGASNAKARMWMVAYSFITVVATLGLHTFIFKFFGINL
jgi:septation ring formation regulator EzrA